MDPNLKTDPPWIKNCETLSLLSLEAQYLAFILDVEKEKRFLEHILRCSKCFNHAKQLICIDSNSSWVNLFNKNSFELIRTSRPRYEDYKDQESFLSARISWRLERLANLIIDAEVELKNLQEELKKSLQE